MIGYVMITAEAPRGWNCAYLLEKAIVMIGRSPESDIVLPAGLGDGVLSEHLQVMILEDPADGSANPSQSMPVQSIRLYNRAPKDEGPPVQLTRSETGEISQLAGGATAFLKHGDTLKLGNFVLTLLMGVFFHKRTQNLGVTLEMPSRRLRAGIRLTGRLTVHNYHPEKHCQAEIKLDGLPDACFEIEPTPYLPPGCDASLLIHFYHNQICPAAGNRPFRLLVTAPHDFPLEEISLEGHLQVDPVYAYHLSIRDTGLESKA